MPENLKHLSLLGWVSIVALFVGLIMIAIGVVMFFLAIHGFDSGFFLCGLVVLGLSLIGLYITDLITQLTNALKAMIPRPGHL